jgi:ABC-type multidrug transport system fused ATPase/permease subunit
MSAGENLPLPRGRGPQAWPLTSAGRPDLPPGVPASGLFSYIRTMSGRQQIVICALACLVAALETVPLELQRRIVNQAIGGGNLYLLATLGAAFLVATLGQGALKYALRVFGGAVSEDVILNARRRLFKVATSQGEAEPERARTARLSRSGRAVSVIGPEMDGVGSFVGEGFAEPLVQAGTFVGLLGYMMVVNPLLAGVSLALFVPQVLLLPWVQRRVNRLTRRRVGLMRAMGDAVAEATALAEREESSRRPARFRDVEAEFEGGVIGIRDTRVRLFRWQYAGKVLVNVFSHLGPLTVLMFGGYLVIVGQTSLGVVVAFVSGFERLAEPARELFAFYQLVSMTRVEYSTITEWVDAHAPAAGDTRRMGAPE